MNQLRRLTFNVNSENYVRAIKNCRVYEHYPFKDKGQAALFKDPVRTALSTLYISVIKTNQFML